MLFYSLSANTLFFHLFQLQTCDPPILPPFSTLLKGKVSYSTKVFN